MEFDFWHFDERPEHPLGLRLVQSRDKAAAVDAPSADDPVRFVGSGQIIDDRHEHLVDQTGKPTWEGLVLGALNKVKRYPREASFRRQQGVPYIRFVMDRDGKVLSVRLERSSGFRSPDDEALALPRRASPLPKPPEDMTGDTLELVVPVEFFMRTR